MIPLHDTMLCFRSFKAGKPYSSGYVKVQFCVQAFNSSCLHSHVQSVFGFLCVYESGYGRCSCGCVVGFFGVFTCKQALSSRGM